MNDLFSSGSGGIIWIIPFIGLLLTIALAPLIAPKIIEKHLGKVIAFWSACFLVPAAAFFGTTEIIHITTETMLHDYCSLMLLLAGLYAISGGITIGGTMRGTPLFNTCLLACGTLAAGLIGTTGASLLFIRPLIRANSRRKHNAHIVIFFIFLVCNVGGALTSTGDPPLLIGFLKGIDFTWPLRHFVGPTMVIASILLLVFYVIDKLQFKSANSHPTVNTKLVQRLHVKGRLNLCILPCLIATGVLGSVWHPETEIHFLGATISPVEIARDLILLVIIAISEKFTPHKIRYEHHFSWAPLIEVGTIFLGIFITLIPLLNILQAGANGPMAQMFAFLTTTDGQPNNVMYFWLTGGLSSFVDNVPTYLAFFNIAGGDAQKLMQTMSTTLLAISAGTVFMGANSYIGNAPNLMIKTIAEKDGIKMPSFFGYMLWSFGILMPCYLLLTILLF